MNRPYIKCLKCGLTVDTMREFDLQEKRKEWFVTPTSDGWTWEHMHNCELAKKNREKLEGGKKKWIVCFGDTYAMDLIIYAKEIKKVDEYTFKVDGMEMTFDCQPIRSINVEGED
ncbi:hypothetical protein [Bacillus phage YungSlug]|nr:hypothetical protein [Bacillus phage YungSlug]